MHHHMGAKAASLSCKMAAKPQGDIWKSTGRRETIGKSADERAERNYRLKMMFVFEISFGGNFEMNRQLKEEATGHRFDGSI